VKQQERRDRTRVLLLDASLSMLEEVGYARFRAGDVGGRAGLSNGLVFKYFPTRIDLVVASMERAMELGLERAIEAIAQLEQTRPTRRAVMEMLWGLLSHEKLRWTYEAYGASGHDPDLHAKLSGVLRAHSDAIDEFAADFVVRTGIITARDARAATSLVVWSMQGLVINQIAKGPSDRHRELIDYLDFLAESAYGPFTK
jgi:AcrR family transcriptional regulator